MSISGTFNAKASNQINSKETARSIPPFCIRLSRAERARLIEEAAGTPLGTYIKAKVLGKTPPIHMRRSGLAIEDRRALAQFVATLGQSRIANNLNQLAHLANVGALPLTPEIIAELIEALHHVRDLRQWLLTSLGQKPEPQP
jgi:hypothetical protein